MLVPCRTKGPGSIKDARDLICKALLDLTTPEAVGEALVQRQGIKF